MESENKKCPPHPSVNLMVKGLGKYYNIYGKKKDSEKKKPPLQIELQCPRRNTLTMPETPIWTSTGKVLPGLMSYSILGRPQIQRQFADHMKSSQHNSNMKSPPEFFSSIFRWLPSHSNIWWHKTISMPPEIHIYTNIFIKEIYNRLSDLINIIS